MSGTFSELQKKRVKLQAKLQQVIEEHSHQDGLSSAETERQQQQEKRLLHQVERLNEFLQEEQPKIGKSGKEIQSNVTDNGPARTPTSHGVIQGQQIYARRLAIVGPVFANLRVQKRLNHFTVRSKAKVDVQWNFSPWPITLVKSTGMSRF